MREDLLQFVWAHGLFDLSNLVTTTGEAIGIERFGSLNSIAGPDFSDARIRIDAHLWIGNVEIHIKASEWNQHRHDQDPAYNNVILHVVLENDMTIYNQNGELIPTLELKGRIGKSIIKRYQSLCESKRRIPCEGFIKDFPKIQFNAWLESLLVNRLERKSNDIRLIHKTADGNWLETFYTLFVGYLGQNQNKLALQELCRKLPFNTLSKHIDQPFQLESMLFGVANLIPANSQVKYAQRLQNEYEFLKIKYSLNEISQQWKFGGIRPEAFPTRRIALLVKLLPYLQRGYNNLMQSEEIKWPDSSSFDHEYWSFHYSFKDEAKQMISFRLSDGLKQILKINVIAPFVFFYGREVGGDRFIGQALTVLESCKPEKNRVLREWQKLEIEAQDGAQSQALIELRKQYCEHKNCVICNVGKSLIQKQ